MKMKKVPRNQFGQASNGPGTFLVKQFIFRWQAQLYNSLYR